MAETTSIRPIHKMLERANVLKSFSTASGILDNGCGPGLVMTYLLRDYGSQISKDCTLTCSDFSEGMVKQVQVSKEKYTAADPNSPWARLDTKVQNAMDLKEIADGSQSHITAGFVYFMTPDPQKSLSESLRVLSPSGVLALSAWKSSQWLDLMNLLTEVRPDKILPTLPEAWTSTGGIEGEMRKAGFKDIETYEVVVDMPYQSYDSFADFMITKMPHIIALSKDMSKEEMAKYKDLFIEKMKGMCATEPGVLHGMSLVALGRK
ncbi:hypothetical protein LTR78_004551 [Recurvomyces mirabilis]|uniref:Methyltransferase type 11 domain-containing protein n=1 Tax=Recurvomyces mirabilis TaxID=574656 RepID=A0AAE0WPG6_9PEZI|nr:hypothetical protein LTR78_004551 [Recurvomyces mirabilis]KAK5152955.1 hypothetical protein LTS14_008063 [Recurvomyces mirabilis]